MLSRCLPQPQAGNYLDEHILDVLFWTSAVCIWHLYRRPAVATLEVHGLLGFPGGYGAVVLFEVSSTRPPSESASSPSTHSVFGSEEAEEVEVEVEEEDNEFEEVEVEDSEEEILVEE